VIKGKEEKMPAPALDSKAHQRRSVADYGPARVRMTAAERLQSLRRRLAGHEGLETLKKIAGDASELASIAPENLLDEIAAFVDRCAEKILLVAPPRAPKAARKRKLPAQIVELADEDQRPISVKRRGDRLLAKLREVHGGLRTDIPPDLERWEARSTVRVDGPPP
jgi:hypothetical protein